MIQHSAKAKSFADQNVLTYVIIDLSTLFLTNYN